MNRITILSFIVLLGGTGAMLASTAHSQLGAPKATVNLQPSTPGTSQSGHLNISGVARAGQFVGGGSGLTSVNAALLAGLPSSAFLQAIPNPLTLTGSDATAIISGQNSSTGITAAGVLGVSTAATGGVGVFGTNTSANGFGVAGKNSNTTGPTVGTYGQVASPNGNAVFGNNLSTTGQATAVYGVSGSVDARVVVGASSSLTGSTYAGYFNAASSNAIGAMGEVTSSSGSTIGVKGLSSSSTGIGVVGETVSLSGSAIGVKGLSASAAGFGVVGEVTSSGIGVFGNSTSASGTPLGVFGQIASSGGGAAVAGLANGTSGASYAIQGVNKSSAGAGVFGWADSATGSTIGASGRSSSTSGTGTVGFASAASGTTRGVYGVAASPSGTGGFFENTAGGLALAASGTSSFGGNVLVTSSGKVSIGGGTPNFPLVFADSLGDKISFFGTAASSHYGIGVQASLFQIHSDVVNSPITFGFGGSSAFTERARFAGNNDLLFRVDNTDNPTEVSTPYDFVVSHDRDNDSIDSWYRVFANNQSIEQLRIQDGDEAPAFFDGAVNANGIDYAEAFKAIDSSLEPGDLVVNHGANWQYVNKSSKAYDQGVIGVVSTKPAFLAGMSFDAEDKMDLELTKRRDAARAKDDRVLEKQLTNQMRELVKNAYRPVAFMGRVPVKVTGVVRTGDHLTASDIPGVAMAMTRPGQSVGIALEPNSGGQGKIMVMVQPNYFAPTATNEGGGLTALVSSMQTKLEKVVTENQNLKSENRDLRAEVSDLRQRLERLEQAFNKRK